MQNQVTATEVIDQLSEEAVRLVVESNAHDTPAPDAMEAYQRTFMALLEKFLRQFEEHHGPERAREFKAQFLAEMERLEG